MAVSPRENLIEESEQAGEVMAQEIDSAVHLLSPVLETKVAKSPENFGGLFNDPAVVSPIVPRNRFEKNVVDDLLYKPKPPVPEYTSLEQYKAQLEAKKPPSPEKIVWGGKRIWKDPNQFKMPPLSGQQPVQYQPSFESITMATEEKVLGQIRHQAQKDKRDFKSYVSNVEEFRNARKHISMFAKEDLKDYLSEDVMALLTDISFADDGDRSENASRLQSEIDATTRRMLQLKPAHSDTILEQPRGTYTEYRKHDDTRRFMVKTLKESPVKLFNPNSVRLEAEGTSAIERFIQEHQAVRESYKKKYVNGRDVGKEQGKQPSPTKTSVKGGASGDIGGETPPKCPIMVSDQGRGWRWARPEDVRDVKWKIEKDGVTNRKSTAVRLLKAISPMSPQPDTKDDGQDDSDEDTPAMRELRSSVNIAVPLIDIQPSTTVILKDPEEVRKGSNALPSTTHARAKGGGALVRAKQNLVPRRMIDETPVKAESVGYARRPESRHEYGRQRSNSVARRQKTVKYYQPGDTRRAKTSLSMGSDQGDGDRRSDKCAGESLPVGQEEKEGQNGEVTPEFASPKRRAKSVTPRSKHKQLASLEQYPITPLINEVDASTESAPVQPRPLSQTHPPLPPTVSLPLKSPPVSREAPSSDGRTPTLSARYVKWEFPQGTPQSVGSFGNVRPTQTPVRMVEEQRSMDSVDMAAGREYSRQMVETFSQVLTTSSLSDTWDLSVDIIQPETPLERSFPTKKQKKVRI